MKSLRSLCKALLIAGSIWSVQAAVPSLTVTDAAQDEDTGIVTVSYSISAPAIVTAGILRDGEPVDAKALAYCEGDVMARVETGAHTFTWNPVRAFTDLSEDGETLTFTLTVWDETTPPDVIVCDLRTGAHRYYPSLAAVPDGVTAARYKLHEMVFRKIPGTAAGVWTMGSNHSGHVGKTTGNWAIEKEHAVCFTNDWYLGIYPVTQHQYRRAMGEWPDSFFTNGLARAMRPVEKLVYSAIRGTAWPENLYEGAAGCIPVFREKMGLYVDLPTDAQWEFSCRAGTTTLYYTGSTLDANAGRYNLNGGFPSAAFPENLHLPGATDTAQYTNWWMWTTGNGTPEVGTYEPNAFGLYDMHGGVFEYCLDWANTNVWDTTCVYTNPVGCLKKDSYYGITVIARGGSWARPMTECRSSGRRLQDRNGTPGKSEAGTFGFRLAIPNVPPVPMTNTIACTVSVADRTPSLLAVSLTALEARVKTVSDGATASFKTGPAGTLLILR